MLRIQCHILSWIWLVSFVVVVLSLSLQTGYWPESGKLSEALIISALLMSMVAIVSGIVGGSRIAGLVVLSPFALISGIMPSIISDIVPGIISGIISGIIFSIGLGFSYGLLFGVDSVIGIVSGIVFGIVIGIFCGLGAGAGAGVAVGAGATFGFWIAGGRLYYWLWPHVQLAFAGWGLSEHWESHPVVWDHNCPTSFRRLDEFLVGVAESSPASGWRLVRRLIRHNRRQRPAALRALATLLARRASKAQQLHDLPRLLAELPADEPAGQQSNAALKSAAEMVGKHWQEALRTSSAYARKQALSEALNVLRDLQGSVQTMSAFLLATDAWIATTQSALAAVRSEVPPFFESAETSVDPKARAFLRRESLLRKLERLLTLAGGGPGLLLYARRRMGKTTLLNNLWPLVSKNLTVANLDLQNMRACSSTENWARHVSEIITRTCREAKGLDAASDLPELAAFLTEVDARLAASGNYLLVAIDEYELLDEKITEGQLSPDVLGQLRSFIQHRKRIRWLISGTHRISELQQCALWASTFTACETVVVHPFKLEETRELLTDPLKFATAFGASELPEQQFFLTFWKPGMLEAIHEQTQGWPALVQGCAREVCRLCNDRHVLESEEAMLEPSFDEVCSTMDTTFATLLLTMEQQEPARSAGTWIKGFRKLKEQVPPTDERVRDLLKRHELIADINAPLWRLRVPLMQRYLERLQ